MTRAGAPTEPATDAASQARALGVDPRVGLAGDEASRRLAQHGANEVADQPAHPLLVFARKFWGLSAWMIELIAALSLVLHKMADFWVALALLLVNALLSFFQEQRASAAVAALKQRLEVTARVLRDGAWRSLAARELVPGDIVRVRDGDFVPADVQLLDGELRVDQSALTGESREVRQRRRDQLVYSGTVVRRGEALGRRGRHRRAHLLRPHHRARRDRAPQAPRRGGHLAGGALAVPHRRRAGGRGGPGVALAGRPPRRHPAAVAGAADERGAGRAAGDVHGEHGDWLDRAAAKRGRARHAAQRRRGRGRCSTSSAPTRPAR